MQAYPIRRPSSSRKQTASAAEGFEGITDVGLAVGAIGAIGTALVAAVWRTR